VQTFKTYDKLFVLSDVGTGRGRQAGRMYVCQLRYGNGITLTVIKKRSHQGREATLLRVPSSI